MSSPGALDQRDPDSPGSAQRHHRAVATVGDRLADPAGPDGWLAAGRSDSLSRACIAPLGISASLSLSLIRDLPPEALEAVLTVDAEECLAELALIADWFAMLGPMLPAAFRTELDGLADRVCSELPASVHDQEMVAALRTRGGEVWGGLGMFREPDRPLFDADEQAFLAAISPLMADAVRRALLVGDSADPEGPGAPGMIVLGPDWRPELLSPGVEEWLRDLPDGNWAASRLPTAVLAVAARAARSATSRDDPSEVAVAHVLTRSGRWVVLPAYRSRRPTVSGLPSSSNLPTQAGSLHY